MGTKQIQRLRKDIAKVDKSDHFEDGTVIRFVLFGRYTYAALRANKQWWTTGRATSVARILTYEELVELLTDATDVVVAESWTAVSK